MPCTTNSCGVPGWEGPLPGDPDNNIVLTAKPGFGGNDIYWSYPLSNAYAVAHVILWRGTSPNFATATERLRTSMNLIHDPADPVIYYYWVQVVTIHGTVLDPIGPVSSTALPFIEKVIQDLSGQINDSLLNQILNEKIDNIGRNYEEFLDEVQARVSGNQEISDAIDEIREGTRESLAFVLQEVTKREEGDEALLEQINLVAAVNGEFGAAIEEIRTAYVAADEALASSLETVNVVVNGDSASGQVGLVANVQTLDGKVTQIGARWTAVVDVNGYVGGFGVYNDGQMVEARFNVDRFSVGRPGVTGLIPFIIEGGRTLINEAGINTLTFNKLIDESGGFVVQNGKIRAQFIEVGGNGANLVPDANFYMGRRGSFSSVGWTAADWGTYQTHDMQAQFWINGGGVEWRPRGGNNIAIYQPNNYYNGAWDSLDYRAQHQCPPFPVVAGQRYEYSVYTGAHRCRVYALMLWFDASGNHLNTNITTINNEQSAGGAAIGNYMRVGGFAIAPPGSATGQLVLCKGTTKPGSSNSWGFFSQPMVAEATMSQVELSPWSPNGLPTTITPAGITTPSIEAFTAILGNVHSGSIRGGSYSGYGWPTNGGGGFYLGPEGLLMGNASNGPNSRYIQITAEGNIYAPGFYVENGRFHVTELNVIDTNNIIKGAVVGTTTAEGNNSVSLSVNVAAGDVVFSILMAEYMSSSGYGTGFEIVGPPDTNPETTNPNPENAPRRFHYLEGQYESKIASAYLQFGVKYFPQGIAATRVKVLTGGTHTYTANVHYYNTSGVPINTPIRLTCLVFKR